MTTRNQPTKPSADMISRAPNHAPTSKEIEDIITSAIALRTKMQCVLWDSSFGNQFGDEIDAMQTDINSIIALCAPLLGWARAGELGDYITPEITKRCSIE